MDKGAKLVDRVASSRESIALTSRIMTQHRKLAQSAKPFSRIYLIKEIFIAPSPRSSSIKLAHLFAFFSTMRNPIEWKK
jgi:hypothetical protein